MVAAPGRAGGNVTKPSASQTGAAAEAAKVGQGPLPSGPDPEEGSLCNLPSDGDPENFEDAPLGNLAAQRRLDRRRQQALLAQQQWMWQ